MKLRILLAGALALFGAGSASAQVIVSDWGGRLTAYNVAGNSSTVINGMQSQPNAMVLGPDGLLYVSDMGSNTVNRFNPTTGAFVSAAITSAQLGLGFQPTGMAFMPNGDLLVADQVGLFAPGLGTGTVRRFGFAVPGGTATSASTVLTGLNQPVSLLYHNSRLYISEVANIDTTQARVSVFDFINPRQTFIAHATGVLNQPTGLAVGPDGNLYVADVTDFAVRKYNFNNPNSFSTFASGVGFNSPTGISFSNGFMFVSNYGTGSPDGFLSQFNQNTGAFVQNAVSGLVIASSVVTIPEPASMLLLGLPAGVVVLRRLRNRRREV